MINYYLITGEDPKNKFEFIINLERCLKRGFRLIQLRAKGLLRDEYKYLAKEAMVLARKYQATLLLNHDVAMVNEVNAEGIHLTSELLMQSNSRPFAKPKIVSAACHNSEQLEKAKQIGVDFVTLSPVCQTTSHLDSSVFGWPAFSKLCREVNIPVYALGGLKKTDLTMALDNGAVGVAAISDFWLSAH